MKHSHQVEKLAKFLSYVLGRRPDEFGLVPDDQGFVKIKELMKALSEEAGWHHVRQNHLREVIYTIAPGPLEMDEHLIRAVDRSQLVLPEIAHHFPKLAYYPVRRRGYVVVLEKGVRPVLPHPFIVLARERQMAERLGRRMDADPVILTVNTAQLRQKGAQLLCFGNHLLLTDILPLGSFSGPPLPEKRDTASSAEAAMPPACPRTPGSYFPDIAAVTSPVKGPGKHSEKQKNAWKRDRKRRNRAGGDRWSDA